MSWVDEQRMPTTADIQSLADVEALYGIEKGQRTMKVSTLARQLGLAEGATSDEVTERVRELKAERQARLFQKVAAPGDATTVGAVAAQTDAIEFLLALPALTQQQLRGEFHGDFDAAASAARSRNLQPLRVAS